METSKELSPVHQADVDALAALSDADIDLGDMPEVTDWSDARRGLFYRPLKKQLTLRLDADVVAWLRHARRAAISIKRALIRSSVTTWRNTVAPRDRENAHHTQRFF